ncbi:MAG: acyl carrier protein [Bacteroidales bacterium]|nr:acyl carrier protein [Bacteroidales bacterium]
MVNENVVKSIIANKIGVSESEINNDSNLANDLGADSLDVVEISMALEREFNVTFTDEDTSKIATFGDIINLINSKLG